MKIVYKPIADLIFAEYNPRQINDEQRQAIRESLERFGFVDPVIVNTHPGRENVIVGGNQRVSVAGNDLAYTEVPCFEVSLPLEREKELNVRLNRNHADWDKELLSEFFETDDLVSWGFGEDELSFMVADEEAQEDDFVPPSEIETSIKQGDLIEIGVHRLICGDLEHPDLVNILMAGHKADMVFTDPPYGVSYVGKTKAAMVIDNDSIAKADFAGKIQAWFNVVDLHLRPGGYVLATVPAGPLQINFAIDWDQRGWLRQIMVWNKDSMVLGHSEYHYKHESILFGWKPGGKRLKNADRTKTTVWDFDRPKASREHPTMKPIAMWAYGIQNHTRPQQIVFDPFAGSGTTIVAAHQLNRVCRAVEISPEYCQVIVNRMLCLDPAIAVKINGKPHKG